MTRQPIRSTWRRDQRGSMAVEVVLLAPVLVMFLLLVVAGGRYVSVRGDVESAARDAVRAASYQRDLPDARVAAARAAAASLDMSTDCATPVLGGQFVAGGVITVELHCSVPYDGLGLVGLSGSLAVSAQSSAPLDLYRRTG